MHPISATRRRARRAGFSMVEMMIALVVLGILVALGTPPMLRWVLSSKAGAATEFYADGIRVARAQAIGHNSASRFVLTENANGQMDWQVDICFAAAVACNDVGGVWSTTTTVAGGDPEGVGGFKSVFRSASALPTQVDLAESFLPLGSTTIYFTSLGWVDTTVNGRVQRITLAPSLARGGAFATNALAISLAGMVSKCDPTVAAHDSRGCPP